MKYHSIDAMVKDSEGFGSPVEAYAAVLSLAALMAQAEAEHARNPNRGHGFLALDRLHNRACFNIRAGLPVRTQSSLSKAARILHSIGRFD
jgi:hypothetical protein